MQYKSKRCGEIGPLKFSVITCQAHRQICMGLNLPLPTSGVPPAPEYFSLPIISTAT